VEAENKGRIDRRHLINLLPEVHDIDARGDLVVEVLLPAVVVELEGLEVEHVLGKPLHGVRIEELPVQVIRNTPAILDLGDHVLDRGPGEGLATLHHDGLRQVFLQEHEALVEVGVVVLVGNAPADGTEFPPLLHN